MGVGRGEEETPFFAERLALPHAPLIPAPHSLLHPPHPPNWAYGGMPEPPGGRVGGVWEGGRPREGRGLTHSERAPSAPFR